MPGDSARAATRAKKVAAEAAKEAASAAEGEEASEPEPETGEDEGENFVDAASEGGPPVARYLRILALLVACTLFGQASVLASLGEYLQDVVLELEKFAPKLLEYRVGTAKPGEPAFLELDPAKQHDYTRMAGIYNTVFGCLENIVRPRLSLLYLFAATSESIGFKSHQERCPVMAILNVAQFQVHGESFTDALPPHFDARMRTAIETFRVEMGAKLQKVLATASASTPAGTAGRTNFQREASGRFGRSQISVEKARGGLQIVRAQGGGAT